MEILFAVHLIGLELGVLGMHGAAEWDSGLGESMHCVRLLAVKLRHIREQSIHPFAKQSFLISLLMLQSWRVSLRHSPDKLWVNWPRELVSVSQLDATLQTVEVSGL